MCLLGTVDASELNACAQLLDRAYENTHTVPVWICNTKTETASSQHQRVCLLDMPAQKMWFFQLTSELAQQHADYFSPVQVLQKNNSAIL